jgi:hypothetical protein
VDDSNCKGLAGRPVVWDPCDVWHRLLHDHPVRIEDPAGSTGRMERATAREFWISIADYPDPLQDALFVIAHAEGFEAAVTALDRAVAAHLAAVTSADARATPWPLRRAS